MSDSKGVQYDAVASAAISMIKSGMKPTVRGVIKVTGGKTETVSGLLRDFFDKRDAEVSKMADELGSSAIASLLASEVQIVVDNKTKSLSEIVERQKEQIAEMVELLNEQETDCQHRIDLAEAKAHQAVSESSDKVKASLVKLQAMEEQRNAAIEQAEDSEKNATAEIVKVELASQAAIDNAEQKANVLVESAKKEADSLVLAANKQIDKAESETRNLRAQVKDLSVDQAKHEIERVQFTKAQEKLDSLITDIAEYKTLVVQLKTEKISALKDIERLEKDAQSAKDNANKLSEAKTQLIEVQKQLSQSQHELSQSNRERESLSHALASTKK